MRVKCAWSLAFEGDYVYIKGDNPESDFTGPYLVRSQKHRRLQNPKNGRLFMHYPEELWIEWPVAETKEDYDADSE